MQKLFSLLPVMACSLSSNLHNMTCLKSVTVHSPQHVYCVRSHYLRFTGVCRKGSGMTHLPCLTKVGTCHKVFLLTDRSAHRKKGEVKTTTMAHCLVCPGSRIRLHRMELHSWLSTQIASVVSNHEQDSKSALCFSEGDRQTSIV